MNRFQKVYQQGTIDVIEIWVDTETGINYVFHSFLYSNTVFIMINANLLTPILRSDIISLLLSNTK